MTLVDTSVWIGYFNGAPTPQTDRLDTLLAREPVAVADLVLAEVLQGFRRDRDFEAARERLTALTVFEVLGVENAVASARHYRALRRRGVTVRKTADVLIASFCVRHGHALLFEDRDFDPFVEHFGLVAA